MKLPGLFYGLWRESESNLDDRFRKWKSAANPARVGGEEGYTENRNQIWMTDLVDGSLKQILKGGGKKGTQRIRIKFG